MHERTLTDGTVWLSRPTEADIDPLTTCCQHRSIADWVRIPVPYRREDAETFLREVVEPGWAGNSPTWAIRANENGAPVGSVGLVAQDDSAAEIGYWLTPEYRGSGLMTRAVALVCAFGFDPSGAALERIGWQAFVGNHASAAVARNTGFHYEGLARLGSLHRGTRRDTWLAGRLSDDQVLPVTGWPAHI